MGMIRTLVQFPIPLALSSREIGKTSLTDGGSVCKVVKTGVRS